MNPFSKISTGRTVERTPLQDVIPLKAPFTIAVSPSECCNFKCIYCGQSIPDGGIVDKSILKWENFLIIMNQIEDLYSNMKIKNFRLSGNGEPLLNKRLPDMVKYIADKNLSDRIEITTNASCLSPEVSDALVQSGLTRLIVSIQGLTSENYHKICGYRIDYEKLLADLNYFYTHRGNCRLHIKTLDIALDKEAGEYEEFYEMFGSFCDTINIENVMDGTENINFNEFAPKGWDEKNRYNGESHERYVCDTLFYMMNILCNGDVNCCGCKQPPHVVGNLFERPLKEIWNHDRHLHDMLIHLSGNRKTIHDCNVCGSILQYSVDDIDAYMGQLHAKLSDLETV